MAKIGRPRKKGPQEVGRLQEFGKLAQDHDPWKAQTNLWIEKKDPDTWLYYPERVDKKLCLTRKSWQIWADNTVVKDPRPVIKPLRYTQKNTVYHSMLPKEAQRKLPRYVFLGTTHTAEVLINGICLPAASSMPSVKGHHCWKVPEEESLEDWKAHGTQVFLTLLTEWLAMAPAATRKEFEARSPEGSMVEEFLGNAVSLLWVTSRWEVARRYAEIVTLDIGGDLFTICPMLVLDTEKIHHFGFVTNPWYDGRISSFYPTPSNLPVGVEEWIMILPSQCRQASARCVFDVVAYPPEDLSPDLLTESMINRTVNPDEQAAVRQQIEAIKRERFTNPRHPDVWDYYW